MKRLYDGGCQWTEEGCSLNRDFTKLVREFIENNKGYNKVEYSLLLTEALQAELSFHWCMTTGETDEN